MSNRKTWERSLLLVLLSTAILRLSPELLAQQTGQAAPSDLLQTQSATQVIHTDPASDSAVGEGQPAQAPPPDTPQTQPTAPQTQTQSADSSGTVKRQPTPDPNHPQNDRIFFALPNYLTVENSAHLPPLTTRQKFKTVAEGCFDPVEVVFIGIQAGLDQADKTNPTYGQGFIGYSKRFGTDYADAIIGNFGTGAIFPTLLHQDPRYFQRGKGNFFYRFGYAAMRVVITRSDRSGKTEFNFSEFLGNGLAAGLSNTYHPRPHTIASSSDVLGTQVLMDALGYELKEFWPDIRRLLVRPHHKM